MSSQSPQLRTQDRPTPPQQTAPLATAHVAPAQADRRARLVLRRVDPWSVLKFSLVFYACMMLIGLLVLAMLWFVLARMGVFDEVTKFADNFNVDLTFSAGGVFKYYVLFGLLGVVLWSVVTVLLTLLFNLVSDVIGGIDVVLAERERRPGF